MPEAVQVPESMLTDEEYAALMEKIRNLVDRGILSPDSPAKDGSGPEAGKKSLRKAFAFGTLFKSAKMAGVPKSYPMFVKHADGTAGEVMGHWRTIHGHKVFIGDNGKFYTFNGYHHIEENPHPFIREQSARPPDMTATMPDKDSQDFYAKVKITANDPAYKSKERNDHRYNLGGDKFARGLPNVAYDEDAARFMVGGGWRKADQVAASTAASAYKRAQELVGLSPGQVAKAKAKLKKETIERKKAALERAKGSKSKATSSIKELPPIKKVLEERARAVKAGDKEGKRKAVLQVMAAMVHAGLLRESTRGETRGQVVIDTGLARSIAMDPKSTQDARYMAGCALVASAGLRKFSDGAIGLAYTDLDRKYFTADPHELESHAQALAIIKKNRNRRYEVTPTGAAGEALKKQEEFSALVRPVSLHIAAELAKHKKGLSPELQALLVGHGDAKAIAGGDKEAIQEVSGDKQRATTSEALAAQKNEKWKAPKAMTMAGFGPGASLHGYQIKGINWACTVKRGVNGFGTGLGKTLTAIGTALKLNADGKTKKGIIIVPVTKITDWIDEAKKAAPGIKIVGISGDAAERKASLKAAEKADLVIMGTSALGIPETREFLEKHKDASLQVDEAHKLKRRGQGMTAALETALKGREYAIGYTATPTANYDEDYFNIADMFRPGCLGTRAQFMGRKLVDKIISADGQSVDRALLKPLDYIHQVSQPWVFVKGRNDPDVAIHVPEHLNVDSWADRPKEFDAWDDWAGDYAMSKSDNPMTIVGTMMALQRMIAISPALVQQLHHEGGKHEDYTGPEPKIDECVDRVLDHLSDATKRGQPFIVSSEFNKGLARVRHRLVQAGVSDKDIVEFTGEIPLKKREEAKRRTNDGEAAVMLLNMVAGGEGLNLQGNKAKGTGPSAMYLLNEPWTHTRLGQVIDRVSRQGQHRETTAWISRLRGSVDEHIQNLVAGKGVIADVLRRGEQGAAQDIEKRLSSLDYKDQLTMLNLSPAIRARIDAKIAAYDSTKARKEAAMRAAKDQLKGEKVKEKAEAKARK